MNAAVVAVASVHRFVGDDEEQLVKVLLDAVHGRGNTLIAID
jgi:hypothetical protein